MAAPQFLQGAQGPLFVLHHPPAAPVRGAVLYLPPFAEEMNKARRMVALQARRFAATGLHVLLPDLYGCGDSGGDFSQARWELWLTDLRQCLAWLEPQAADNLYLWGLRGGALLASALLEDSPPESVTQVLFWQPIASGEQMLNQFLRLRFAAEMMQGQQASTKQLRAQIDAGQSLEIAGYELHPELAAALARARLKPPTVPVTWLELSSNERPLAPASQRVVTAWREAGVAVTAQTIVGEPFWSTQEITEVPALLDATMACFGQDAH